MLFTKIICRIGKILFILKRKNIPKNPEKILIIRSGAIGDVLMSTPFLIAIKKQYPNSKLYYLLGKWSSCALKNNPNIDKIIEFDDHIIYKKKILKVIKLIYKLRKEKFDLCFILDKSWLWGLLAWLCNIKFRIGFDRKGEGFAHNISIPFDGSKYELEYYLDLSKIISIKVEDKKMKIYCNKKDKTVSGKFLIKNKLKNKILIGIAPGGALNPGQNFLEKRWPIENYEELIKRILKSYNNFYIILFGGISDKELLEDLKNRINFRKVFIAPLNSIQVSYLLMDKCKLLITHDSGAMHIAGSSNAKVITLFGPTQSKRFAPKNSIILEVKTKNCPCYDIYGNYCKEEDCMKNISINRVFNKINQIIKI